MVLEAFLGDAMNKAMGELQEKSMEQIQHETAITWAGRALASYTLFERTGDLQKLLDGEEFAHEAVEHASLAGSPGFSDLIAAHVHDAREHALAAWGPR
jgi:hypothetical protein